MTVFSFVQAMDTMSGMGKRVIRVVILVMVVGACTSCAMWSEKTNPPWKQATGGEQFVRLFWQDIQKKDWRSVNEHLAPMAVAAGPRGTYSHDRVLEYLKQFDIESFQIGEVQTQPAGDDIIVTYMITIRGSVGGRPLPSNPLRVMDVWQHLKHGWVLVAHSIILPSS